MKTINSRKELKEANTGVVGLETELETHQKRSGGLLRDDGEESVIDGFS